MLNRGFAILRCLHGVVSGFPFRLPPPPLRFFSTEGSTPPPHDSCRLRVKKADGLPQLTLSETILQTLSQVAARTPYTHASSEPSEQDAISEALRTFGFEDHIQEFVGNQATLPLIRKVQLLMTEGAAHSDVKLLLRKRAFLTVSSDKLTAVHNVLKRYFSTGEIAFEVIALNPGILLQPVGNLERKLQCLEDFEVGKVACLKICTSNYQILSMAVDGMEGRLVFLQRIGLTVKDRDSVLRRFPQTLKLSVEKKLQPTVNFFVREGMDRAAMLKMLCLHPGFFGSSIDKNLALKMDSLKQLGLTPQQCCTAIGTFAQCSCQQILTCYNALKLVFSADNVSLMIRKRPDILSKSVDSTQKKLDYLVNVENRNLQEIVRFPAYLTYSLERRIAPRFKILKEKNLARNYSLNSILSVKPELFKKRFNIPQSVEIIS